MLDAGWSRAAAAAVKCRCDDAGWHEHNLEALAHGGSVTSSVWPSPRQLPVPAFHGLFDAAKATTKHHQAAPSSPPPMGMARLCRSGPDVKVPGSILSASLMGAQSRGLPQPTTTHSGIFFTDTLPQGVAFLEPFSRPRPACLILHEGHQQLQPRCLSCTGDYQMRSDIKVPAYLHSPRLLPSDVLAHRRESGLGKKRRSARSDMS